MRQEIPSINNRFPKRSRVTLRHLSLFPIGKRPPRNSHRKHKVPGPMQPSTIEATGQVMRKVQWCRRITAAGPSRLSARARQMAQGNVVNRIHYPTPPPSFAPTFLGIRIAKVLPLRVKWSESHFLLGYSGVWSILRSLPALF